MSTVERSLRIFTLAAALSALVSSGAARAEDLPPTIDLFTMGDGDDLFSHFGHAAICVHDARTPRGRCYNYGTTDFSTPVPLTWDFIRGRAKFWVSVIDERAMLDFYRRHDRTIYRQRLPLSPERAAGVARALEESTQEAVKYYRYHHFLDNCTTRIRDLLDRALDGQLSRDTKSPAYDLTFRQYAQRGFAGDVPLLIAAVVILGRSSDVPTTDWEGMFLPEVFRREVTEALGVEPEIVYARKQPSPVLNTWGGEIALGLLGLVFAVALLVSSRLSRRLRGAVSVVVAFVLGLCGLVLWTLALVTQFAELRENEVLLVLVPFDFLLALPAGAARRVYVTARLAGFVVVLVLSASGVLVQPLLAVSLFVALPLLALWALTKRPGSA